MENSTKKVENNLEHDSKKKLRAKLRSKIRNAQNLRNKKNIDGENKPPKNFVKLWNSLNTEQQKNILQSAGQM